MWAPGFSVLQGQKMHKLRKKRFIVTVKVDCYKKNGEIENVLLLLNRNYMILPILALKLCLRRDVLAPQLCILFWSGVTPVLLACPQAMSF
jgi:hypothetical protein